MSDSSSFIWSPWIHPTLSSLTLIKYPNVTAGVLNGVLSLLGPMSGGLTLFLDIWSAGELSFSDERKFVSLKFKSLPLLLMV